MESGPPAVPGEIRKQELLLMPAEVPDRVKPSGNMKFIPCGELFLPGVDEEWFRDGRDTPSRSCQFDPTHRYWGAGGSKNRSVGE